MRDAVGSTWIFSLVISFTLIFAIFLVLALSYAKAYKVKNEMTSIIEKYEGLTNNDALNGKGSIQIINQYLNNSNYKSKGKCQIGDYAADDLSLNNLIEVTSGNSGNDYYYCISTNTDYKTCNTLFRITVFYDFNLPLLGNLRKYGITGQTNEVLEAYFLSNKIPC